MRKMFLVLAVIATVASLSACKKGDEWYDTHPIPTDASLTLKVPTPTP